MMLKHFIFSLVILSIVKTHGCVNSCLDLDGNPVDQWVLLTPPELHISDNEDTKYGFYFGVASISPNNDGSPMTFQAPNAITNPDLHIVKTRVEDLIRNHVKQAARENQEILTELRNKNPLNIAPRFWNSELKSMPKSEAKPRVYQYWINDQAEEQTNIQRAKAAGKSFEYTEKSSKDVEGIKMRFKSSHSKWLISHYVGAQNEDDMANRRFLGYMLVHSFPKVPANLYPAGNDWYNPDNYNPKIFTDGDDGTQPNEEDPDDGDLGDTVRNPFRFSQHAYCFNIYHQEDMMNINSMMDYNFPYIATFNFLPGKDQDWHKHTLSTKERKEWKNILAENAINCLSNYNYFYTYSVDPPSGRCFMDYKIRTYDHLFSHEPLPHIITKLTPIPSNLGGVTSRTVGDPTKIAPVNWAQVSDALKTTILLSHWRNLALPDLKLGVKGVKKVAKVRYGDTHRAWTSGQMHEKIGVGNKREVVCFGDANHSGTQQSHAGITICVRDKLLHTFFKNGIQELQDDTKQPAVVVPFDFQLNYIKLLPPTYLQKGVSPSFVSQTRRDSHRRNKGNTLAKK